MHFRYFLLLSAVLIPIVLSVEVPEYYQIHNQHDLEQVCTEAKVGQRANIYCTGPILETVMALHLFNDSKSFVDRALKYDANEVNANFSRAFPTYDNLTEEALMTFIDDHFEKPNEELQICTPEDWSEEPAKLVAIRDPVLRKFALQINAIWKKLCRRIDEAYQTGGRHSMIYVPHNFVVPGGRFREWYNWDSLWIVKGLISSDMKDTARGMLENFVYVIRKYGLLPNGGRIYYLARSQPPMLIAMFYDYFEATGDLKFLEDNIVWLEKEIQFWETERSVEFQKDGQNFTMYRYYANSNVPRPESYREDVELVKDLAWKEKLNVWRNLASAAESGWDFSSRWLNDFRHFSLASVDTTNILPVDLNSFICRNLEMMAYLYSQIPGKESNETFYRNRHAQFKKDFQKVFYVNDEDGWYDYHFTQNKSRIHFYGSNLTPIFARCYDSMDRLKVERAFNRFRKFHALNFTNGIPTSLYKSNQQWDMSNAWPPLDHITIDGLRRTESWKMQEQAYDLAKKFIKTNWLMFEKHNEMFEKYNVEQLEEGRGGEYLTQSGFGWTNAAVLDLLVKYGNRLNFTELMIEASATNKIKQEHGKFVTVFGFLVPTDLILLFICFSILFVSVNCFICLR